MDQRCLSLRERCRRGSLPLKKRRLNLMSPELSGVGGTASGFSPAGPVVDLSLANNPLFYSQSILPQLTMPLDPRGEEALAALALVSASRVLDLLPYSFASSSTLLPPSDGATSSSSSASGMMKYPFYSQNDLHHSSEDRQSPSELDSFTSTFEDAHSNIDDSNTMISSRAAPFPGYCHGKNSRSNSYCRKQASYLGNKYCKVHDELSLGRGNKRPAPASDDAALGSRSGIASHLKGSTSPSMQPQDKRYTGAAGEICCQATTTRGRPCTFVAVDNSRFCHLHASASSSSNKMGGLHLPRRDTFDGSLARDSTSHLLLSPTTSFDSPSGLKPTVARGNSKRRAKYSDSPHPLLSKIPVDQWYGQTVRIACGPMQGKIGSVEKWGNGWITVQIPGNGPHNRRSFELYVVSPRENDETEDEEQDTVSTSSKIPSALLLRSTVSPSPSSDGGSTKCPPIVNKVSYSYDADELNHHRFGSDSPMPAVVLETPQTTERTLVSYSSGTDGTTVSQGGTTSATNSGYDAMMVPHVTPVSPKKAQTELPLAESLVLAQEGGAKKYRIDMLFGTAALERSRRSIHRPSRYDDSSPSTM